MSTTDKLHWLVLAGVLSAACACGSEDTPSDTGQDSDESQQNDEKVRGNQGEADADTVPAREGDKKPDAGAPPKLDAGKVDAGGTVDPPPNAEPDASALRDAGVERDAAGGGPITPPPPPTGPLNGDPSNPVVSIPEVPCGPGRAAFGQSNLKIGGRDVILTYPCEKREGAHVTFILNLHGTTPEASRFYSHGYFAAYRLATSHNLIVLEPKSLVDQWGNQMRYDPAAAAKDRPHLLEAIDWVYEKFSKFNITGMWVAGHSWGSFYAKGFVCDEAVADKVKGVIGQSGGTGLPGAGIARSVPDLKVRANCQDFISQIHTAGDQDSVVGNPDQTAAATKHGCDAKAPAKDLGGKQMMEEWPNCDPGWVHENILMGAHTHTTPINPEVVQHIIERVKATEKR